MAKFMMLTCPLCRIICGYKKVSAEYMKLETKENGLVLFNKHKLSLPLKMMNCINNRLKL